MLFAYGATGFLLFNARIICGSLMYRQTSQLSKPPFTKNHSSICGSMFCRFRENNRRAMRRKNWWLLGDPQKAMRAAVFPISRYLATPRVAKHRLFVWMPTPVLATTKLSRLRAMTIYFKVCCNPGFMRIGHSDNAPQSVATRHVTAPLNALKLSPSAPDARSESRDCRRCEGVKRIA